MREFLQEQAESPPHVQAKQASPSSLRLQKNAEDFSRHTLPGIPVSSFHRYHNPDRYYAIRLAADGVMRQEALGWETDTRLARPGEIRHDGGREIPFQHQICDGRGFANLDSD